jgi:DNA-binding NarL/FixJ family response regulator
MRSGGRSATILPWPTVLIVDDHAGFRTFARALLEAEGFDVVGEAGDGASALALTRTLAPELVLLDVALPDIDGFKVCEALLEDGPGPAVVLTSSLGHPCESGQSECPGARIKGRFRHP